jgi:hypothetical protein
MLPFLRGKATNRKRRLLAVAACRLIWHLISDEKSQEAVEVAERLADGMANEEQRSKAEEAARNVAEEAFDRWDAELTLVAAAGVDYWAAAAVTGVVALAEKEIEETISEAGMALAWFEDEELAAGPDYWAGIELSGPWPQLIRDIFGNPFRSAIISPAWLSWSDSIIPKLAQSIYDERAFVRLPILADALEEAGCANADILNHCRLPGEHVRGCWVVDLILGKK